MARSSSFFLALVLAASLLFACGSSQTRVFGPGPEYEDPNVPPAVGMTGGVTGDAGAAAPLANPDAATKS